jgi:arylsulfatase A-like enzyme
LTADPGESFGEHGFYGHMVGLYSETLHVPLVIRHPQTIEAGTVVTEPVSLHRLHDTLLALSGVKGVGRSLLSDSDRSEETFVINEQMRPFKW